MSEVSTSLLIQFLRTISPKSAIVLQKDRRYEMVDARVWRQVKDEARESPVRFLKHPLYQKGSGGPQKPFSWLSEGVKEAFTINTEAGEQTLIPHSPPSVSPHILVGSWCGSI
jgi:hypothetical protein